MTTWVTALQRIVLLLALSSPGCGQTATEPSIEPFGDAELTALFIGNSLTESNDLPAMVASIAEAAGHTFEYRTLLRPSYSLADHFVDGAATHVRELAPDVVVLQQGPSSVGDNPMHLRAWAEAFADVVEDVGGRPALLMVWPERTRMEAFDAVRDSYAGAAEAVDGIFIPAGDAWREVWARDAGTELYGPDGFHPSRTGSFVAALTVFGVLFGEDVRELPPLVVDPSEADTLYEAVHAAVEGAATPSGSRSPSPAGTAKSGGS